MGTHKYWTIDFPDNIDSKSIPQQDIGKGDCGIFTILFAEMIGCNQNIHTIQQDDITDIKVHHVLTKLLLTYPISTIAEDKNTLGKESESIEMDTDLPNDNVVVTIPKKLIRLKQELWVIM